MSVKLNRRCFLIVMVLLLLTSCITQRRPGPGFGFQLVPIFSIVRDETWDEIVKRYPFYRALGDLEEMEALLKAGQNPNRMKCPPGEDPWYDSNPLWLKGYNYDTMELLIRYKANVTKRPYIARTMSIKIISERYPYEYFEVSGFMDEEKEVYRRVKLLLEAGADPNMKGTSSTDRLLIPADWNYQKWFNKYGTLPINNAIEYCAFSIVDLLLEHGAKLDNRTPGAAKQATKNSFNTEMENYIKAIWAKQRGRK
jgi:hypothetical protein